MKTFFVIVIVGAVAFFCIYNTVGIIKTIKNRRKKKDTDDDE